jgi:hypothetical protein
MARGSISLPQVALPDRRGFLETKRKDTWWLFPTITLVYFLSFIIYSTWAAFQGNHYFFSGNGAQYLSPMYSPVLWSDTSQPGSAPLHHAIFGEWPDWLPKLLFGIIPITPALLILWAPGGFRFTCYYYRGAYYKAFWGDPPNCAVGEPRKGYWGERWAPLVLMNVHRYFLYLALIFNLILTYDAIMSYSFVNPDGSHRFGIGVGSIVITLNAMLLAFYSFGCHSLRHLVGGKKDCIASSAGRKKTYDCVSCFNRWHMQWAWLSLFWVGFTDLYIRMCSMGIWSDWRIL